VSPVGSATGEAATDTWSESDTRLPRVMTALDRLRQEAPACATRSAVVNLVILAGADDAARRATYSVIHLGAHHPGRIIVILPREGREPDHLEATVELHQTVLEGRPVWWDVVRLEVAPVLVGQAHSLVEPLLLHDLPVTLWLAGGARRAARSVLGLADQVVVSGERAAQQAPSEVAHDLVELSRSAAVADLAWLATEPSRQSLARLFEAPERLALLRSVQAVRVQGPPWSSRLLAGWLMDRLDLPSAAVSVAASERLEARLDLGAAGSAALDGGAVWPAGQPGGGDPDPGPGVARARLGDVTVSTGHGGSGTARLLSAALRRPGRDARYLAALPLAGKLAG
jgi:hypothetical protein